MNYIGSKYSLLQDIASILDDHAVPCDGAALDLFAGTGAVAQFLKQRGHLTYANDWQHYSYLTCVAFVEHNDFPTFDTLFNDSLWERQIWETLPVEIATYSIEKRGVTVNGQPCVQVLSFLSRLPGRRGPFYEAYCHGGEAGRNYYAQENGLRIQAIRDQIESWRQAGLIEAREKAWLVACLLEAADRAANTASVYGAYLKHVKRSAQKPLALVALQPVRSSHPAERHHVFQEDGLALLNRFRPSQLRLIYVDPPYNHRQYAANYHILETISRWDVGRFVPRGVTGLRPSEELRSDYCARSAVEGAFRRLFERVNSEYLLFSYNNEGLLSESQLQGLFEEFCSEVDFRRIHFRRFRADVDGKNRIYKADHTHEFLVLGKPRRFSV